MTDAGAEGGMQGLLVTWGEWSRPSASAFHGAPGSTGLEFSCLEMGGIPTGVLTVSSWRSSRDSICWCFLLPLHQAAHFVDNSAILRAMCPNVRNILTMQVDVPRSLYWHS